ncbi:MAG: 3-dehydroquinate synthase [Cellvibrionaceae bacterium]
MRSVKVQIPGKSYNISIGQKALSRCVNDVSEIVNGRDVCIVTNQKVSEYYLESVKKMFVRSKINVVLLPDGEQFKTLETVNKIFDTLLENKHHRTTVLVALGGGVVGDMTGFAAASYQRGVDFIQIPTTLLAQVDSSVGGKTGVNHRLGKNMIGAFHQPQKVIIDIDVLKTLPSRELSAGLAEVIKYGLIADAKFYHWLENHIDDLIALDNESLVYAIERSCQIKADIVAQDERESGVRAYLNFGHTFGHAIENAQGYGSWLHGEAVAVGMVMALDLSIKMGWIASNEKDRLVKLLVRAKLPVTAPKGMTTESFLSLMAGDKKVLDGEIRLVLLKSIGEAVVTENFSQELLIKTIESSS